MQKLKPNLLLDVHLYNHVDTLYEQIRHKAIIQYTAPFISVDLHTMATSFKTSVAGLEKELAALIMENQIQVRLLRFFDQFLFKSLLYMFCASGGYSTFQIGTVNEGNFQQGLKNNASHI